MKKTSKLSRRKFLSGLGIAAGIAAAGSTLKSNILTRRLSRRTSTHKQLSIESRLGTLKSVKIVNRSIGTFRLPLASRSV